MDILHSLLYVPIFNILILLYQFFGENLGLALIGIAIISRLITIPITNKQIETGEKNKEFQDKYNELKKKYGKNKEKFQQEAAKLQAEYLPGQLSGCLPMIFQLLMFIQIYNVIKDIFKDGGAHFAEIFANTAWGFIPTFPEGYTIHSTFLGVIDLSVAPKSIIETGLMENFLQFLPYLILIILVMVTQFLSMKVLTGLNNKKKDSEEKKNKKKKKNPDEPDMSDIMKNSTSQMQYFLPFIIGFFSFSTSAGLALYWTVQSTFVIIQGLIRNREEVQKFLDNKFNKKQ